MVNDESRIDTPEGWNSLILDLCDLIEFSLSEEEQANFNIAQTKEKLGSLRFYCDNVNDVVEGLITMAIRMSTQICQICGSNDTVKTSRPRRLNRLATLCRSCRVGQESDSIVKIK